MLPAAGTTQCRITSRKPPSRRTMVQENTRTSPLVQNGRITRSRITWRQAPVVVRTIARAVRRPSTTDTAVVQSARLTVVHATPRR